MRSHGFKNGLLRPVFRVSNAGFFSGKKFKKNF